MSSSKALTSGLDSRIIFTAFCVLIATMNNVNYFNEKYDSYWFFIDKMIFAGVAAMSAIDFFCKKDAGPLTNLCMLIVLGMLIGPNLFFGHIPELERRTAAAYSFIFSMLAVGSMIVLPIILFKNKTKTPAT